jgi:hypothetical protein
MWSGLYSNAPDFKKQIKDYSALFHAQSRLFAKRVLNQVVKNEEIEQILRA